MKKPKLIGQMIAWPIELLEFKIMYEPRGPMKAQCLANFVAELITATKAKTLWWKLFVDGYTKGSRAGVILESPDEIILEQSLQFEFKKKNN